MVTQTRIIIRDKKKTAVRLIFFMLFSTVFGYDIVAQELLTGLQINPVVKAKFEAYQAIKLFSRANDTTPVQLPFLDDFSANGVFPDNSRWIDCYAFENNDIPVYPINMGAATLDAINDSGTLYAHAVPGPQAFIADHLTSRYIRLDSLFTPVPRKITPADSVYLSFYYQPQGRARAPQEADSLILQLLAQPAHDSITPDSTYQIPDRWNKVWFSTGMSLDTFYFKNNQWFVRVMIPITDSTYFTSKFRFQFFNYVSLASSAEPSWESNCDQWNIDQVYLNLNRSQSDTVFPELRFIYRPPSLLDRYESMPYPQYCDDPTNEVRDTLNIVMTNRDLVPHMSSYNYYISNPSGSFSKTYNGGNYNIQPYTEIPYVTYQKFAHPEFPFLLPIGSADSAIFLVKHVVREITAGSVIGDTMESVQRFYNYFAYDDGTPDASYGLTPAGSQLAYRFKLNKSPDTLRAIRWYFNRTLSNESQQFFYMCVWNDNAGIPGDTIYSDLVLPKYADSLNKFVTYHLNPPLKVTGVFYVGWIQTTNENLSVGFDQYNNSQNEIFYNSNGTWNNSSYPGSLMIRPVVGKPIPVGQDDVYAEPTEIRIFPNPCTSGRIRIMITDRGRFSADGAEIRITDLAGHVILRTRFTEEMDISGLTDGFYILTVQDVNGRLTAVKKLIVSH